MPGKITKPHSPQETNYEPTNPGKVAGDPSQNASQKTEANPGWVNLFAPESGSQILVASIDDWKYTIDGKEDWQYIYEGPGKDPVYAVYGFKDDRSATFDTFAMLIIKTADYNVKEFELLAGNDTPLGAFESIGKFQTQNIKLFKTPYQEFRFPAVTAKYLKIKLLSTYSGGYPGVYEFQLFGSLK